MNKFKVCVYAICKNEEKFIDRWYESMKEADSIYVLDTGSIDNSVSRLKSHGVNVLSLEISPFRFDVARNKSLELLPNDTDICVCTDLDEVFNPGWRDELEKYWDSNTTQVSYNYNWSFDKYNNPSVSFYYEKIHSLDYKWVYPVHEVLKYTGPKEINKKFIPGIVLNHYPDSSKSRSNYLSLLELSVKEDPYNDRNMHYLGREYMFHGMWHDAIDTLIRHLNLDSSTWDLERCASMRFISRCYNSLNNYNQAKIWLERAINEAPYVREGYTEYGLLLYQLNDFSNAIIYLNKALEIKDRNKSYINESFCFDHTIYDVLSVCYDRLNDYKDALYYVTIASKMDPDNERILNNKKIIEEEINP